MSRGEWAVAAWLGAWVMTKALAASATLFRDREFYIHDGSHLRRVRMTARTQFAIALLVGLFLAFTSYSTVRFLSPAAVTQIEDKIPDDMARLAALTQQRVDELEQRQQLLAAMMAEQEIDPSVLKHIATVSTAAEVGAMGGPFEPVRANSDSTFKQLFSSWKKLDSLSSGAIAVPSEKPVKTAAFTSGYGVRSDPFNGGAARHMGIDLAGPIGTPIYATADGRVYDAGWNTGGYGNLIKIDHGRGIETRYGHLSQILVHAGQIIHRGDLIARMGSTGRSTGSHLHYEVRIEGRAVNPIPFMKSTDYLLAMQRTGGAAPMDGGHIAQGGPTK